MLLNEYHLTLINTATLIFIEFLFLNVKYLCISGFTFKIYPYLVKDHSFTSKITYCFFVNLPHRKHEYLIYVLCQIIIELFMLPFLYTELIYLG